MKSNKVIITIAVIMCCVSFGLVLYPTASQIINKMFDKNSIIQYNNQVSALDVMSKTNLISQAQAYNDSLLDVVSINNDAFSPDAFDIDESYENILSVTNDGLIGTVSIPKIDCNLPIYHGTTEDVLDKGAVHMANTSFPIGGKSTHTVVSAHTAYPGKEFFNRLTELECGDYFYFTVLGDTLAYKVCRIDVVLPTETELLNIEKEQDLATLITCTPYSVNTHRLLVRGQRDLQEEIKIERADAELSTDIPRVRYTLEYICIGAVIVIVSFIVLFVILKKRKEKNSNAKD